MESHWRRRPAVQSKKPDKAGSKRSPLSRKLAAKKHAARTARASTAKWSQDVTQTSNALDLEPEVFKHARPSEIAASLKRSAERSTRRKGSAYQSAMSMLTFFINRAGRNLSKARKETLERAKGELRKAFGRQ